MTQQTPTSDPALPLGTDQGLRLRLLNAALEVFSSYGFQRASMSAVARAAQRSRTALYQQFRSKEELFLCLIELLHEQSLERALAALAQEAPLQQRLTDGLAAKHLFFQDVLRYSKHGAELTSEHQRLGGDVASASRKKHIAALRAALHASSQNHEIVVQPHFSSVQELAELLYLSTVGLEGEGLWLASDRVFRKRVARLVSITLASIMSTGD